MSVCIIILEDLAHVRTQKEEEFSQRREGNAGMNEWMDIKLHT